MRQEEDNFTQDIMPTMDTQSNPKIKKMQKRKVEDNFNQIQLYDQMLDDKLVELRNLLQKEKSNQKRTHEILRNAITNDPFNTYGKKSITNQGAHHRARANMIKSSLDRNKSMLQIESQSQNNGYIDLNRSNHRKPINKKCNAYIFS